MLPFSNNNATLLNLKDEVFTTNILPDNFVQSSFKNITRDEKHYFLQFNFSNKQLPHQGFKIHISCTEKNFQDILNSIYTFCFQHKVDFKYISNKSNLLNNLAGKTAAWNSGKFITIYPNNLSIFKEIIEQLYVLNSLKNMNGIFISSDRRYKDSNIIFYRYGVISGPDMNIYRPNSRIIEYQDYTKSTYRLPSEILEPFPVNADTEKKSTYLFKSIIPLKAINSRASGATFLALDKQNNQQIILKHSKVGFSEGGISSIESLKNEECNLKRFEKFKFIPSFLGSFTEDHDYFICEQLMPGKDVDTFRASTNKNFLDSGQRINIINLYKDIIIDLISNLNKLHEDDIFLGDLSSTNILINEESKATSFIDISQSFNIVENKGKKMPSFRTQGFYNKSIDSLPALEQDNQQLGYVIMSMFCRANMFLLIDKTGKISHHFFNQYASLNKIPKVFVNVVDELIDNPNLNLVELIKLLKNITDTPYIAKSKSEDLESFRTNLQKTVFLSKINKLIFKQQRASALNATDDFIFDNKLLSILPNIIQNKKLSFNKNTQQQLFEAISRLNYLLTNQLDDKKIQNLPIKNIFALLLCAITKANITHKEVIKQLIHTVDSVYRYIVPSDGIFYKTNLLSNHLSPYLVDGTAGMLMILLKFKEKFNDNMYDAKINELVNSLDKNFMPQSASLMHGLSGIILSLLMYTSIFKDYHLVDFIKENIKTLPYYAYQWNNQSFIIGPIFCTLDINFENGNKGVLYMLKIAEEMKLFY